MKKIIALVAITIALACSACAKKASTGNNNGVFPTDLKFQQPQALK